LQTALVVDCEHLEYLEMKRNALDADIEQYVLQPPEIVAIAIKAQRRLSRLFYHSIHSLKRPRSTQPDPYQYPKRLLSFYPSAESCLRGDYTSLDASCPSA